MIKITRTILVFLAITKGDWLGHPYLGANMSLKISGTGKALDQPRGAHPEEWLAEATWLVPFAPVGAVCQVGYPLHDEGDRVSDRTNANILQL